MINSTTVDPEQIASGTTLYTALFQYSCFHLSGLILLLWDYLLTLDWEVQFFWTFKSRGNHRLQLSAVRGLFFLNRYLPIITQAFLVVGLTWPNISPNICTVLIKRIIQVLMVIQWFAIPGAILCYRTCALYKGERKVMVAVVAAYIASITASAAIVGVATKRSEATAHLDPSVTLHVCQTVVPDRMLYAAFIPPVLFDVGASFMSMYAILRHYKNSTAAQGSHLMSELAKGTVIWMLVVVTLDLINLCIFAFVQQTMRHVFDGLTFAIISITSSRQLLHLRQLGSTPHRPESLSFSTGSTTLPVVSPRSGDFLKSFSSAGPSSPRSPKRSFGEKIRRTSGMFSPGTGRPLVYGEHDSLPLTPISPNRTQVERMGSPSALSRRGEIQIVTDQDTDSDNGSAKDIALAF